MEYDNVDRLWLECSIRVRRQEWDESPDVCEHYAGIYTVTLCRTIDIMFIPKFERTGEQWPPHAEDLKPNVLDGIGNTQDARLWSAVFSENSVTPASAAGRESFELPPYIDGPFEIPHRGTMFYVSEAEFTVFDRELADCAERISGLHSTARVRDFMEFSFVHFVLTSICPLLPLPVK